MPCSDCEVSILYIYIERERDVYVHVYIYIYIHTLNHYIVYHIVPLQQPYNGTLLLFVIHTPFSGNPKRFPVNSGGLLQRSYIDLKPKKS